MERGKIRKKHLKRRILFNISMILVFSMVISTIVSYFYFEKVVREQKISDEKTKLQQVANQINFMTEDIHNFGKSIIVDDTIQGIMEDEHFDTEYQRIRGKDIITKQLVFYNSLRTYIGCSYIELPNGQRFTSNSSNSMEEGYLNQKFTSGEIREYNQHKDWIYSDPYYSRDPGSVQLVFCTKTQMLDKYRFGEQQGILYMEIYMDHFLKQIQAYEKDYENVCLQGNGKEILYEKNPQEQINRFIENNEENPGNGVYKVDGGYLLCEDIEAAGWKLFTLITDRYLWERSSFVLEFFLLSLVISLGMILLTTSRLLENIIRPVERLSKQMEHMDYKNLHAEEIVRTGDEIQTLYECYGKMLEEIQRSIEESMEHEKQKKDMEFDIMLSQINPHYLYNVLNTVVYLATAEKNENIIKIVNSLIYTLQETLKIGDHNIDTTIQKELELTECYLNIQEYRYPDRFQVQIRCDDKLKSCVVPKTIIQPIVENAIFHGILPDEQKGIIDICITRWKDVLCIEITDDGIGIAEERLELFERGEAIIYESNGRKHIGISNVRDRIRYLYGEPYGMWISRIEPQGTRVTLHLPVIYKMRTNSLDCTVGSGKENC